MITKQLAIRLVPLINSEDFDVLKEYVQKKLDMHIEQLISGDGHDERHRGAIEELRTLIELKAWVDKDKL